MLNHEPGPLRGVRLEPGSGGSRPVGQDQVLRLGQGRALLSLHARLDVDTGDLQEQGKVAESGPECLRGNGRIGAREQRIGVYAVVVGGQFALDLDPRSGGGDPVEFVEEARDSVALGVEVDDLARPRTQEEEPQKFRRQDLSHRMGRCALALGGGHLLAADVEELVGDVARRLHLEDLAADGVGAVARPTGRSQIFAAALDRHSEKAPFCRPFQVPGQLGVAAKRRNPALVAAALRPRNHVGLALVRQRGAVPAGGVRGADLAALLADDLDRQPFA